ncbi:MAG: S-layer homology domain-containing protein, partial [Clostridiales Family XIII bacterium]|nr:S-layer homology domain-containing protein [Clostridiales Family XIII bacterium]
MIRINRAIRSGAAVLCFVLLLALAPLPVTAEEGAPSAENVWRTAAYVYETVKKPGVGSVGGEWAVIGLARSAYDVPDAYYAAYYERVEAYVKERGGVLHDKKYTEYSRVILGLTAAGYDPRDVGGYDLTAALGDFERTVWQGVNGPIWALIALDSADYPIPQNPAAKTQATRDLYIDDILRRQLPDGGWNLSAGVSGAAAANEASDPDITGMALQALANYTDRPRVKAAAEKALVRLSELQDENGGYTGFGDANSESVVQVLIALCALGVPTNDARFMKNGATLLDNIQGFENKDGGFRHMSGGDGDDLMATEQALCGLVAAQRARDGMPGLYHMEDAARRDGRAVAAPEAGAGLPGKHADVTSVPVSDQGRTFADIQDHANRTAIEALAARGIVGGRTDTEFDPDAGVTRAEFAAVVTRALGLAYNQPYREDGSALEVPRAPGLMDRTATVFDVPAGAWYYGAVGAAYGYGIVSGTSSNTFNPGGAVTRQEAAVMVARAAGL